MYRRAATLLFLSLLAVPSRAQNLVSLIPTLYGPGGITVDTDLPSFHGFTHHPHFATSFLQEFQAFNEAFASQLSTEPVPSPASGFTYSYDSALGVFKRSSQSFGPILTDRSETIGKGKFTFGFNYQYFNFDSLNGVGLHSLPAVLQHLDPRDPKFGLFTFDVITLNVDINATVNQVTAFATYGLINRVDASVAVPLEKVSLSASGQATIQRLGSDWPGSTGPLTHFFSAQYPANAYKSGTASGVGDVLLRLKGRILESDNGGVALGLDTRFPTGDELNLLGTGAWGIKPYLVASYAGKIVSPHVNLGYQWNGDSYLGVNGNGATVVNLANQPVPLTKGKLPNVFFYEAGLDAGITKRLTLAVDYLGRDFINAEQAYATTFEAPDPGGTLHPFPDTQTRVTNFNTGELAAGLKFNPAGNLLIDVNVLFSVDHNGLHHDAAPLFGFEYTF
jgi:hypothetical protein